MLKKNKNIFLLSILGGLMTCLYGVLFLYLPLYLKYSLSFNGTQIGIILGMGSIITIITIFPTGVFSDRIKAKKLAALGMILAGIFFAGMVLFKNFYILFWFFLLMGLSENIIKVSTDSILLKTAKEKILGENFGFYNLVRLIVIATGIILTGYFLNFFDFSLFFKISFFITAALIFLSFFLPKTEETKFSLIEYKKDVLNSSVLFFFLIIALFAMHFGAEKTSFGLFLQENLNLDKIGMGFFMASEDIILGITAYFIGTRIDKGDNLKKLLYLGLILSGVFHILMAIQNSVFPALIFRLLHGVGDGILIVLMYIGITKLFVPGRYGGNNSLLNLAVIIGVFFGSLIYGPIGEIIGYKWPLIISGIVTLFTFVLAWWYKELLRH